MVLQIEEVDETGNLTATYVESSNGVASRVDIIVSSVRRSLILEILAHDWEKVPEKGINIWSRILNVFLPAGYPHSVTPDYIQYGSLSWTDRWYTARALPNTNTLHM